jgi:hypothetical protein
MLVGHRCDGVGPATCQVVLGRMTHQPPAAGPYHDERGGGDAGKQRSAVLHRQVEALGLDYVTPFRIITPEPRFGGATQDGLQIDPFLMQSGNDWRSQANAMIRRRKRDPAAIKTFAFPVNYQVEQVTLAESCRRVGRNPVRNRIKDMFEGHPSADFGDPYGRLSGRVEQ